MAVDTISVSAPPGAAWARRYPPIVLLAVAVLVAALILPSALNLPQSNPSTVLEYAPVPPEDDNPPPPAEGNVSSLGLGRSNSLTEGGQPPPPPPPPPPPDQGAGSKPGILRCVEGLQTEDPNSPPCVPFFEGDNFGATYQGVTGEEITVVVYFDQATYSVVGTGAGELSPGPDDGYIDASGEPKPPCPSDRQSHDPDECDHVLIRVLRAFSKYFNSRYQTYKRQVHYWAYFADTGTAAQRRSDAQKIWNDKKPFAVIDQASFDGNNEAFVAAMAGRGVMTFSSTESKLRNEFYRQHAPKAWGWWPDVEHWAELYSTYVCQKVVPYPVSHYGRPQGQGGFNGEPRKFGLFYTSDPDQPGLRHFADLVKDRLRDCGVTEPVERTFPRSGYAVDSTDRGADQTQAAVAFQQNDVTTILYLGGVETRLSNSLAAQGYYPEIVVAGDLSNDNNFIGRVQNQDAWDNAWATTFHIRLAEIENTPGFQAYKEGYPQGPANRDGPFARDAYYDHFMLFTGIQVAGPRLNPTQIDEGFHAIPERQSTDPFVAAVYFDPGDFSAVKDAAEQWWDRDGRPPGGNQPGCWRMVRGGQRFPAGTWEGGDDAFANPNDPCTGYGGSIQTR